MLTWDDKPQKDSSGTVIGMRYTAHIPHWGEAHVYPQSSCPGEMFLDCPGLGIRMHPLGRVTELDALGPAEMALMRALEQHGVRCLEALVAIGGTEE